MQLIDTHGTFDDALADASPEVQRLADALRDLLRSIYPEEALGRTR